MISNILIVHGKNLMEVVDKARHFTPFHLDFSR